MPHASQQRRKLSAAWPLVLVTSAALASCGATPVPALSAVTLTDISGHPQPAVASLPHGTSVYLTIVVSNDPRQLGAAWNATCTTALPPGTLAPGAQDPTCGAFTYAHTMSGPMPAYPLPSAAPPIVTKFTAPATIPPGGAITIVAHATSNPAITSTLTLRIT